MKYIKIYGAFVLLEERYPHLEEEENIRIFDSRGKHCRYVAEENAEDRSKFHDLRCEVYMEDKQDLIKIKFLLAIAH